MAINKFVSTRNNKRSRLIPFAGELSDGSTNFFFTNETTLDSSFTFSRNTLATEIVDFVGTPSSRVQYSPHNLVARSTFPYTGTPAAPTGWSSLIGTGTSGPAGTTVDGSNQWSQTAAATRPALFQAVTSGLLAGVWYQVSFYLDSIVSGSVNYDNIFQITAGSGTTIFLSEYYRNNTQIGSPNTTSAQTGRISIRFQLSAVGAGGIVIRLGLGSSGSATASVVFSRPQLEAMLDATEQVRTYFPTPVAASFGNARFSYDSLNKARRGLLIEGSATNLVLNSNFFPNGSGWVYTNTTVSPLSTQQLPSGLNNDNVWEIDSSTGGSVESAAVTVTAGTVYTFSFWAKRASLSGSHASYRIWNNTAGNAIVAKTSYFSQLSLTAFTRVAFTFTVPAGCTSIKVAPIVGDVGEDVFIHLWGMQLEAGNGASSYIQTGSQQVSRAADSLSIADITRFNYSTTNGTLFYTGIFSKQNVASYPVRAGFMTASDQPVFEVFTNAGLIMAAARGSSGAPEQSTAYSLNTHVRFAASFDAALSTQEVKISLNGGAAIASSATGLTATFTPTRFVFGRPGYEAFFPCGLIEQVRYWPTTKSGAELTTLTA